MEVRRIWASAELNDYVRFPYVAQVFALQRETTEIVSQKSRSETLYGVTSLAGALANPQRLLGLSRGQWSIENRLHWVRDVTFDEDRSRVRRGKVLKSWPAFAILWSHCYVWRVPAPSPRPFATVLAAMTPLFYGSLECDFDGTL